MLNIFSVVLKSIVFSVNCSQKNLWSQRDSWVWKETTGLRVALSTGCFWRGHIRSGFIIDFWARLTHSMWNYWVGRMGPHRKGMEAVYLGNQPNLLIFLYYLGYKKKKKVFQHEWLWGFLMFVLLDLWRDEAYSWNLNCLSHILDLSLQTLTP